MRHLLTAAALALVAGLTGHATAATTTDPELLLTTDSGKQVRYMACVVRWERHPVAKLNRSRPVIYRTATHPCHGITAVRTDWRTGRLVVTPERAFGPILHFSPQPDETLTLLDIDAGASVGPEAHVQFARGGKPLRADDPIFARHSRSANLWIEATSTVWGQ